MKTNQTKPDRGQDASIAARERKERIEPRFVLFSLRSLCSFAAFLLLLLSAGSGFAAVRCVDANSTNATPPYTSWTTAAATIQQAVDAAAAGDEIVVTNGTYATGGRAVGPEFMTNRVTVDKPLRLRSVNGPQFTIIQGAKAPAGGNGEGAIRCVHLASGASLSGFTLTNGATRTAGATDLNQSGGGVWCSSTNAALTNCVIAGNSAQYEGGGASGGTLYNCTLSGNSACWGGGVWMGTLHNCVLTGNSAKFQGGGAGMGTLHNCVLTGNSANSGGGVSGGTLVNCTVTGNSAESGGGADVYWEYGYVECSLRNCIVYFNRAPKDANYSKETTFYYSCTTPLPPGPGNIDADPRFVNAATGDFRLRPDSPCIDAGTNLTALISTDFLGLPRALDGNGDGIARADMGAYEFNPYRFEPALELTSDGLVFTIRGEPGKTVRIERTCDLVNWDLVATVPIPASGQTLIDPAAAAEPFLFYRAVLY